MSNTASIGVARSKCCLSRTTVQGRTTLHYRCEQCKKPTDLASYNDERFVALVESDPRVDNVVKTPRGGFDIYLHPGWRSNLTREHVVCAPDSRSAYEAVLNVSRCTCRSCNE